MEPGFHHLRSANVDCFLYAVFYGRPPVDGALEGNKRSIVMSMRNCTIFLIASNKFSSFRSRNTFYFQANRICSRDLRAYRQLRRSAFSRPISSKSKVVETRRTIYCIVLIYVFIICKQICHKTFVNRGILFV